MKKSLIFKEISSAVYTFLNTAFHKSFKFSHKQPDSSDILWILRFGYKL